MNPQFRNEGENIFELMAFLHGNADKTKHPVSGRFEFSARIAYRVASGTKSFVTQARVETGAWNGGIVSLTETPDCPTSNHRLDFRPTFDSMRYDRDANALVIEGESEKVGPYKVTLIPL